MSQTKIRIHPSEGEKWILRAYIMLAMIGAVVGFFLLYDKFVEAAEVPVYRAWLALGGAVGLTSAAFLTREGFGHRGMFSGVYATVSSIAAVLLAGVIGGTIALPVFGTMFGPWLLVATFVQAPILLVPVAVAMWTFHISYQRYRDERETIFQT